MKPIKISIALSTYNGEDYIGDQLNSFAEQIYLPDELIVCDDCSQDSTVSIVQQFAYKAPFEVRVFVNERNIGYIKNFSKALSYCSGDIVLLSDQDDVWFPNKLLLLKNFLQNNSKIQLVIHDIAFCSRDLIPIGQTKIERMRGIFDLQSNYVVGMASAIRNDFLKQCLPVPDIEGLTHDSWLHMCAQTLGVKAIVEDVLALHRRHDNNVTASKLLNVDYVTTPEHFRKSRPNLFQRLDQMKHDMILRTGRSATLLKWLEQGQEAFLQGGYAESANLDRTIIEVRRRYEAESLRSQILCGYGWDQLWAMFNLYRSGGYAYFQDWKSLVSDFIFRFVLRV